jgi:hypothetical protein
MWTAFYHSADQAVVSAVTKHRPLVEGREFLYQLIFSNEKLSCMKSDEINCPAGRGEGAGGGGGPRTSYAYVCETLNISTC